MWSYGRMARDVATLAAGLRAAGVGRGDRVVIHLENCPEFVIAWFATAWVGAVVVTTNAMGTPDETAALLARVEPALVLTQPSLLPAVSTAHCDVVVVDGDGDSPTFDDLMSHGSDRRAPVAVSPREAFSCQFTSGTTARPKGVVWTHANALWAGRVSAMHQGLRASDVHLINNPLFHTNAQTWSLAPTLWVGGTAVLVPKFSASRFWDVAVRNRCTWASVTNFMTEALRGRAVPTDHDFRLWGGAVAAPDTDQLFGVRTIGWWGMTETVTQCIVGDVHQVNRPGSLGRPSPGYGIEVRDQHGNVIDGSGVGELLVRGIRGLSLFDHYLDDPAATEAAFRDGWLTTGDQVRVENDGSLTFLDRIKDILKVGGENVAASEIEQAIRATDLVAEVAVVGQSHALFDEVPVAFVIPAACDSRELSRRILLALEDSLSRFKVPWAVHVVDDLPRSTLEKVAKARLRARLPVLPSDVRRGDRLLHPAEQGSATSAKE